MCERSIDDYVMRVLDILFEELDRRHATIHEMTQRIEILQAELQRKAKGEKSD
jgi:uncharacterized small protein (DUF1192 family)